MIYFDNSATTNFKPLSVKYCVLENLMKKNIANPGRSGHNLSVKLGNKIYKARENFAKFFNISPFDVIFTSGCTEALNLGIFGTVKRNSHIITTINEHNSVLRALKKIEREYNIEITYVKPKDYFVTDSEIEKNIRENTYMVIVNHTSNVTGATCDIESIGKVCKRHNIMFMVDGAQSVGHIKIDMQKCNINMLAIAGHKGLHGITGVGALLINMKKTIYPLRYGGTGTESENLIQPTIRPEGLESGTLNYLNILAFEKGLLYTEKNFEKINNKIGDLTQYLLKKLNEIKNIEVYSCENNRSGVVSFNIINEPSSKISDYLNSCNIYIRSGLHCAPLVHKSLGTLVNGTCRVSLDFVNTKRQIDKLIVVLKSYIKNNTKINNTCFKKSI